MSEAAAVASAPSAQPQSNPFSNPDQNQISRSVDADRLEAWGEEVPGELIDPEADRYTPKTIKRQAKDKQETQQLTDKQVEKVAEQLDFEDLGKYSKDDLKKIVKHRLDMDRGAYAKMQEAAKIRKEFESREQQYIDALNNRDQQFLNALKENPDALLEQAGYKPQEFAYNRLNKELEDLKKTPEQRQVEKLLAEKEQLVRHFQEKEQQELQTKEQQKQQELQLKQQQEIAAAENHLQEQFIQAYEKTGLPPNQRFARWMAADLSDYYGAGIEVPVEFVAQKAYDEFRNDFATIASKMSEQQLRKFVPKELMQKISKLVASEFSNSTEFQNKIKPKRPEAPTFEAQNKHLGWADIDAMRKEGKI